MTKKKDLPAWPFYIGDWFKAPEIRALDLDVRMLWFEMMCFMWQSDERGYLTINGNPVITPVIAKMLGVDIIKMEQALKQMVDFKIFSKREDGAIYSRSMVDREEKRKIKSESGTKGMESRYSVITKEGGGVITPVIINSENESISTNKKEFKTLNNGDVYYLKIIPAIYDNDSFKKVFDNFIIHRQSLGRPINSIPAFEQIFRDLKNLSGADSKTAIKILENSIRAGYPDIYELSNSKNNSGEIPKKISALKRYGVEFCPLCKKLDEIMVASESKRETIFYCYNCKKEFNDKQIK